MHTEDIFGVVQTEDGKTCQLLMFQETVGKQHGSAQWSDVDKIVGACEKKPKEVKKGFHCLLIYLIPQERFTSFTCPARPTLSGKKLSVLKGRLNVDMPDALTNLNTWEEALKEPWNKPRSACIKSACAKGSCNLQSVCFCVADVCKGLWM
jgi:hypothetical protein